jgi:hypothetical protein
MLACSLARFSPTLRTSDAVALSLSRIEPHLCGTLATSSMATERATIPGIVKNGMVIPKNDTSLPEGAHVDIILGPADVTPELQAEWEQWDKASDAA